MSMFFRNLTLFRVPADVCADVRCRLDDAVAARPLREPGPLELATSGFIPPVGRTGTSLVHWVGECAAVCVGSWEKILPAAVVGEFVARRIAEIQEREDRRVGARERKRINEEIVTELLARAFSRPSRQPAYLDFRNGWLVVDTGSRSTAEGVVSALREALGQFPVTPMAPAESPRAIMTDWLINKRTPSTIVFGDEAELRDPVESGAAVRVARQELEADEVQEHLKTGKQVYRLGIEYAERMSFVLAEDLVVRKLRFLDVVLDELGEESSESMQAEFEARFALLTLELARLFESFADWFGIGEHAAMRLDHPPTPKAMRA